MDLDRLTFTFLEVKIFKLSIGHTSHMAANLINHSGIIFDYFFGMPL